MLKSMTGYGIAAAETEGLAISIEVKSLNSKFLDLNIKAPKEYADKDIEIRNVISSTMERGKVTLSIEVERGEQEAQVAINRELITHYYKELKETAMALGAPQDDLFRLALQMPKVVNSDSEEKVSQEEWSQVVKLLRDAIKKCEEFRIQEGKALEQKFKEYIERIGQLLKKVNEADPQRIESIRERVKNHFADYGMNEQVDKNRFEQELIYYIEKLDISEEKVRLRSHLDYFLETLAEKESNGKKLGFIAQELGREINTIGSKANDVTIQRAVVEMKEELEKIKEQVMNIL